jgi:hypothetical protein
MIAVSTTLHNYLTVTTDNINIGKIQGNVSIIETRNDVWALWSPLVKRSVMVERAVHVPQSLYSSDSFTTSIVTMDRSSTTSPSNKELR